MATAATDVWLNSGPGQRLDGQTATSAGGASGSPSGGAAKSEDELLAMALSASMEGGETGGEGTEEGGGAKGDEVARAIALSLEAESPGAEGASALRGKTPSRGLRVWIVSLTHDVQVRKTTLLLVDFRTPMISLVE